MSEQVIASATHSGHLLEGAETSSDDDLSSHEGSVRREHSCFHTFRVEPALQAYEDLYQEAQTEAVNQRTECVLPVDEQQAAPMQDTTSEAPDTTTCSLPSSHGNGAGHEQQTGFVTSHHVQGNVYPAMASNEQACMPIPSDAYFLITHWRNNMGNWFSPLHSSKHPWIILHLPVALITLSELQVWGETKHARAAILYSLLSLSAFTLAPSNESGYWRNAGLQSRAIARAKMKESLASEFDGPGKAKYKEILLAFLTLISISVCCV